MTAPLIAGETLPALLGKDEDGNEIDITASVAGHWAVIQFYRGHW